MNDSSNGAQPGNAADSEQQGVQIRIAAQYVKDLSFENPNIERLLSGPGDNPNLNVEVNVNSRPMAENLYESAIHFTAQAVSTQGVIYDFEVVYAGLFHLENLPQEALEPFMLVNAPTLLFPFLRRLVADVTREGGFPPLLLDPIDFAQLYLQRQQQAQAGNDNG
ncbi:MAG: protein-export chaperone SecB [Hyphomicrobiaceae bacterium]